MDSTQSNKAWQLENANHAEANRSVIASRVQTEREILFHALATQHLQRVRIIELLSDIKGKLELLVDVALRSEGGRR